MNIFVSGFQPSERQKPQFATIALSKTNEDNFCFKARQHISCLPVISHILLRIDCRCLCLCFLNFSYFKTFETVSVIKFNNVTFRLHFHVNCFTNGFHLFLFQWTPTPTHVLDELKRQRDGLSLLHQGDCDCDIFVNLILNWTNLKLDSF